ncbi:tannase/feruloyl esterase family alpha/beta hydrolase [Alicyclobacillus contaminans]|uniref:tannase/feruloyl esterase family alpha/beta hydrolase n=1 Tax=Alicyclobacillus contaminans TaxID=392016 RepID=UPI001B7F830C|nr:tannase/feruloyl esterase family alpha/beta hydrolase [Alicyclobacillus contaminans]
MEDNVPAFKPAEDLTTNGWGVDADAEPLVERRPRIERPIPGGWWTGTVGGSRAVVRLPEAALWNGKLMIGATPAVRNEFSLDLLLSDIALQRGYAYAACDKGTPGLVLRDPDRQMTEWPENYRQLTEFAKSAVRTHYGQPANKVYISGVSNGGYITRIMLERFPELFDGGVEWEGVLWQSEGRHLLTCLPVYVQQFPVYANWRGDSTSSERHAALEALLAAGLHPETEPYWPQYFMMYWLVSLWLYGRNLDPDWAPFAAPWDNRWLQDPSPLAYPWADRLDVLARRIEPIANTGHLTKPLLSVAGNWDCLVAFPHHAQAYARLVESRGAAHWHRLYEIERGNHVDGMLRGHRGRQQAVHPSYEAALHHLEAWVERGIVPPPSGRFGTVSAFAGDVTLYTSVAPSD